MEDTNHKTPQNDIGKVADLHGNRCNVIIQMYVSGLNSMRNLFDKGHALKYFQMLKDSAKVNFVCRNPHLFFKSFSNHRLNVFGGRGQ